MKNINVMKKWNKKQINALKGSIEHWEQNVNMLLLNYFSYNKKDDDSLKNWITDNISFGYEECKCCEYYYKIDCARCPISIVSNIDCCYNTPYKSFTRIFWNYIDDVIPTNKNSFNKLYKAACDELEFLYSVLSKGI